MICQGILDVAGFNKRHETDTVESERDCAR
jgi:hypothetical protein